MAYKLFENKNNIIEEVNDMLMELNDSGFQCDARPSDDYVKAPKGFKLVKTHDIIDIVFRKERPGFEFEDIREVYLRIKSYLEGHGFVEEFDFERKEIERKEMNKDIKGAGKTLLTQISFIKEL